MKAKNTVKPFIPVVICAVIIFAIICIWLLVYQCKPEPYVNTITRILENNPDVPTIEISEKGPQKNILQKILDPTPYKIPFIIHSTNGSYNIEIPSYEDYNFAGKGLVIAASGNKYRYITGLYTNLYVIRNIYNSNIPVEVFYVGKSEKFPSNVASLLESLGNVTLINLMDRIDTNVKESELRGYQTKPLACLCSSFEEMILMDADALSFIDPYHLFDIFGYTQGMVLFRDYVDCMNFISQEFMDTIGIGAENYCRKTEGYEIDSSCIVLDKQKCWEALYTICIINVKSDAYYKNKKNVLGDKDTWLIGSLFVGLEPYISKPRPAVVITNQGKQILGHLQSTEFSSSMTVPIYYNNQMVDLITADVSDWTFKVVKNPRITNGVPGEIPFTPNMINSFNGAKKAMDKLLPVLPTYLRKQVKSINGVTPGFIP